MSGENCVFVATGITDGDLVRGVRFTGNQAKTHSILIHSSTGTVRFIESVHRLGAKPHRRRPAWAKPKRDGSTKSIH